MPRQFYRYVVPIPLNSIKDVFKMIRSQFVMWGERKFVKDNGKVGRGKYPCNQCQEIVGPKDIDIDHVHAVGDTPNCILKVKDYDLLTALDYEECGRWLFKVFCLRDNLQRLCKACHKAKTVIDKARP